MEDGFLSAYQSKISILVFLFPYNAFRRAICILPPGLVACCSESIHSDVVVHLLEVLNSWLS